MIINEKIGPRCHITIRKILPDGSLGEIIEESHNIINIAGAGFLTRKLFSAFHDRTEITPSYNDQLGLDNNIPIPVTGEEYIYLFCMGVGGCGKEPYQKYEPEYLDWIRPENMVPFKYVDINADIADSLRDVYYGRCERTNKIIYYFKAPENIENPEIVQQYIDGTPIDSSVYNMSRTDEGETRVQLHLKVTKEEGREFFRATTGINTARINQISLCTAYPKTIDGKVYYQNIRPVTLYNFNNIYLIDEELGADFKYDLYF